MIEGCFLVFHSAWCHCPSGGRKKNASENTFPHARAATGQNVSLSHPVPGARLQSCGGCTGFDFILFLSVEYDNFQREGRVGMCVPVLSN